MPFDRLVAAVSSSRADLARGLREEWAWVAARADCLPWRPAAVVAGWLLVATSLVPSAAAPDAGAAFVTKTVAATSDIAGVAFSSEPGRVGAEASARSLALSVGVPLEAQDWRGYLGDLTSQAPDACPASRLEVSWSAPLRDYRVGAHVEPLGPVPTEATDRVNGIVVCEGSSYAYLGFEAAYQAGRWRLTAVPALAEEDTTTLLPGEADATGAAPAITNAPINATGAAALPAVTLWDAIDLEAPAPHVPQVSCDPAAKEGVLGFRDLLLSSFPGSRNLGIGRACEMPGVSEHKEGRAFDWGVRSSDAGERQAAETVLGWLLGPDSGGRPFAIARRTGLMYVIWDGRIWSAERAVEGWRPYVGVSDHTDHVHFSFSWSGALAQTSFWTGELRERLGGHAPDLPLFVPRPPIIGLPPVPGLAPAGAGPAMVAPHGDSGSPSTTQAPPPSSTTTTTAPPPTSTTTSTTTTTTTTAPAPAPAPEPTPITLPPPPIGGSGLSTLG